ncbi:MAG: VOC family protein [Novosphingobium sp.]|nr:VOC family protein [Novosphingobium sp.]
MTGKATVCLWFNGGIEDAARFYCRTFPDTMLLDSETAPEGVPDTPQGKTYVVNLSIMGIPVMLLDGGPHYPQTEAFSFQVSTEDQAETDRLWTAILASGGSEGQCGWCKDRWGVSWQIVPRQLTDGLADPDREVASRVQQAMMPMKKIDIAAIQAARIGEGV